MITIRARAEPYQSKSTTQPRGNVSATESYDWRSERVVLPDGRFGMVCHFYDLTERQKHEAHVRFLLEEVNHRSKNLTSIVQAIARQSASSAPEDFLPRFERRLRALGAAQDLLLGDPVDGAPLDQLVRGQLAHFGEYEREQISVRGPEVRLRAAAAQSIGMALHELGTNACKYGALSTRDGRVAIEWTIETLPDGRRWFTLSWVEEGGPKVASPTRRGFGRRVVEDTAARTLDGSVTLSFGPDGVVWRLECAAGPRAFH